jgi:ppGpp synthetase/RelA/SpoT-type nucleotidyltranferase
MKEIFKAILKYLFANTKLDEKVADMLETAKTEAVKLDEKFDNLKEEVEKEEKPVKEEVIKSTETKTVEEVTEQSAKKTTKKK